LFCLNDQEKETFALAKLIGVLRSDDEFRRDYDSRVDGLLAANRIWIRHEDGSLTAPADQLPSPQWVPAHIAMQKELEQEGFTRRAVSVLKRAGYRPESTQ